MNDRKRNNLIGELKTRFSIPKFEEILKLKVDWLMSLDVKIIPVGVMGVIESEDITYGGKVTWEKGSSPKKPISLMLNMLDFRDTKFIVIFLHECGHVKDKDNGAIHLETIESEISAWNNAISDFKTVQLDDSDKAIFSDVMEKSLLSYKVDKLLIETMISKLKNP